MMRVVALLAAVASASAFSVAPVRDRHCYLLTPPSLHRDAPSSAAGVNLCRPPVPTTRVGVKVAHAAIRARAQRAGGMGRWAASLPGACRSPTGTCAVVSLVALGKETV